MALLPIRRNAGAVPARRSDTPQGMTRIDPWNDFDVMDRMFDSFFRAPFSALGRTMPSAATAAESAFEMYETPEDVCVFVYAPGIPQDAFDINITGDTLTVKAERKPLLEAGEGTASHTPWSSLATSTGTFNASYTLPIEVDQDRAQASYKDGVLQIRMPKTEAAKPRQIKLQVNNG